jgi:TolB-like protein/Flp pilus assembly protein TadD
MSFLAELKRRSVFRVGAAYLVVAWLLMQVTDTLVPALHMPHWVTTVVVFLLLVGFVLALVFAWAFELTPGGLKREAAATPAESVARGRGRQIDYVIIGALVLALGYFIYDKFLLDSGREASPAETAKQADETQGEAAADARNSIAVLPFVNMSADPEQEYFVDGLAEELLNLLASIPELRVAARTSSFSFKGANVDIRSIAEKLDVEHILEGSVRKADDTLRITAQLIDADSGYHIWSQQFDRQLEDVFAIQEEISASVVDALRISLLGELPKVQEINPEAYTLYLRGKYGLTNPGKDSLQKAVDTLQAALELEPDYAPALLQLGWAYFMQASTIQRDVHEGMALARTAVERALASDDRLAEAHIALGWIHQYYDWDWQAAEQDMQRALALGPGDVAVLNGAGVLAGNAGRLDEAIKLNRRAVELDPLSFPAQYNLTGPLVAAGRLDEADTVLGYALELAPQAPWVHFSLGVNSLLRNQPERALTEMKLEVDPLARDLGLILGLSALGREAEAEQALEIFSEKYKDSAAFSIAQAHAWRGNADEAFLWLDTAFEQRTSELATILWDPVITVLKSDPRWPVFLARMGLPPEPAGQQDRSKPLPSR